MPATRPLNVFLCHASQDKPAVHKLYERLAHEPWITPWLDVETLLPGQDWDRQITAAIQSSDVIIVALSKRSVSKEGYVQKEIRFALDRAREKPEGEIFLIPLCLEPLQLKDIPLGLRHLQRLDFFGDRSQISRGYRKLLISLELRASSVGVHLRPRHNPRLSSPNIDRDS
jgi:TIR domain-containing protein